MNKKTTNWKLWNGKNTYGEVLYKRAIGELDEMESSKALSKLVSSFYKPGMKILDVGCGAGHYLRSLRIRLDKDVQYTGVDATKSYIELAKKAFVKSAKFFVGDIFDLKFKSNSFDIVMCNNVILHMPPPPTAAISELMRVAKKYVVIRTLFGERNYIIKEVKNPDENIVNEEGNSLKLIKKDGEPAHFGFFNLYTTDYIKDVINSIDKNAKVKIIDDIDWRTFDNSVAAGISGKTATRVTDGKQVSGNIILDWKFVIIEKNTK